MNHLNTRAFLLWNGLTTALRTGTPQSSPTDDSFYQLLYADQAALHGFAEGMTGGSLLAAQALATRFAWHQHRTLIDIGTAQGCLPVQIAQVHPHLTGGGFDLPAMQPLFDDYVREHGFSSRLHFYAGDFLKDPLPTADVIVFGRVLHNWDLPTRRLLLKKAYDALPSRGAIIIYERLIDDERRVNVAALLASLAMVVATAGGSNFSGADCLGWMGDAGFRDIRSQPLTNEISMVTGLKR